MHPNGIEWGLTPSIYKKRSEALLMRGYGLVVRVRITAEQPRGKPQ